MISSTPKNGLRKTTLVSGLACAALFAFAMAASAEKLIHEDHEAIVKVVVGDDDSGLEVVELDASEMVEGETRVIETDSGKVVEVMRTDSGFEIWVDGEELDLPEIQTEKKVVIMKVSGESGHEEKRTIRTLVIGGNPGGSHDEHFVHHGDGGGRHMIFVSEDGQTTRIEGDGETYAWSTGDEGSNGHYTWSTDEDGVVDLKLDGAAEHLIESGALDGLDEATREHILDTLRQHQKKTRGYHIITKIDEEK